MFASCAQEAEIELRALKALFATERVSRTQVRRKCPNLKRKAQGTCCERNRTALSGAKGAKMRKHSKVILVAEEQLVFGHSVPEMVVARDNLRSVIPGSLLLELLDARIARQRRALRPASPWAS